MLSVVIVVCTIIVTGASLDPTCFPGCKNTKSWSSCIQHEPNRPSYNRPHPEGICLSCTAQLQRQSVLDIKNSSQPTTACLPNNNRVAIRGFSFGKLSVQKLRPPQQSEVRDLAFIECGITDLEQGLWTRFPQLRSLQLDFNNLTHVKRSWFGDEFQTMTFHFLSLSHNFISSMDSKCFQNLTSLVTLLLDNNSLQSVQPSWFYNLKWLRKLSLKSNSIKIIPQHTFNSLSLLVDLDLSSNVLTYLLRETVEGLHRLRILSLGGNRLLSLNKLDMNWQLGYRLFSAQRIAVRVNEALFCITESPEMAQFYHVQMQHDNHTQAAQPSVELKSQCTFLQQRTKSQTKYSLPLILISVNNTESDKHAGNITHLCQHAWENVPAVKVALPGRTQTLHIVPVAVDKSCKPQIVAIVLSDVNSSQLQGSNYNRGIEEMKNVTCVINTWEKTHLHVFTAPMSSTPDGTVCEQQTETVFNSPYSTLCRGNKAFDH
ncbi:PREDICTED: leucine-rich repeat-containing protein 15-like [Branchiostoma belcheri]|uniref:Leucine-rich repeat-containing protein 15-like n=1 Tax=Branchiostoma belcheri TaxID=7741 RepID=A0A6P4Y6K8_BRABE|nr:PREDICTED: leucine-rich repeat-containing protein 15-like [Branchiostoma belcheri]